MKKFLIFFLAVFAPILGRAAIVQNPYTTQITVPAFSLLNTPDATGKAPTAFYTANTNFGAAGGFALVHNADTNRFSLWSPTLMAFYGLNNNTGIGGISTGDFLSIGVNNGGTQGSVQPTFKGKGDRSQIVLQRSDGTTFFQVDSNGITGVGSGLTSVNAASATNAAPVGNILTTNSLVNNNKTAQGSPWTALRAPLVSIYNSPYVSGTQAAEGESRILTNLTLLSNSGDLARITNGGEQFAFYFDVGSFTGRVSTLTANISTNWPFIVTNWGTLVPDPALYPQGLPWILSVLHSNNIRAIAQIYVCTDILPSGADMWLCSADGSVHIPFTNGTGLYPTNSFGKYEVMTSLDPFMGNPSLGTVLKHDVSELARLGFDGYNLSDIAGQTLPIFQDIDLEAGNDALRVSIPVGYNNPISFTNVAAVTNYAQVDTSKFSLASIGQFSPDFPMMEAFCKPMVYMAYQTANLGQQNHTLGYVTSHNHAATFYENNNQGSSWAGFDSVLRDFGATRYANDGSYIMWPFAGGNDAEVVAMLHAMPASAFTNNVVTFGSYNGFITTVTNLAWQAIHNDPLQAWPSRSDYLVGTNFGTIYIEPLANGDKAVAIYNKAGNASFFSVGWNMLGFNSNVNVQVTDVLAGGTTNGVFTNNFYVGIQQFAGGLWRFSPLPPVQLASQFNLGSFSAKNTNDPTLVLNGWSTGGKGAVVITRGQPYTGGTTDTNVAITVYGAGNFSGSGYTIENQMQLQTDNNSGFGGIWFLARNNGDASYWTGFGHKTGGAMIPYFDVSDGGITRIWNTLISSNGLTTVNSNGLALQQITFPATTLTWTNTAANTVSPVRNINLYIDNTGVTGTVVKKNGSTIASSILAGDLITMPMKPGDFFSETYTIGTPVGKWEPQ